MAAADPVEVFLHNIAALPIFRPESTENDDVPDTEDFDNDASQFTTASIISAPEGDISEDRGALAGAEQKENVHASTMKTGQNHKIYDLQTLLLPSPGNPSPASLKCLHPPISRGQSPHWQQLHH